MRVGFAQMPLGRRSLLLCSGLILLLGLFLSLTGGASLSPWLRIFVGLLVFLLPGGYLFVLAPARDSWDLIDLLGYGFTYSIALVSALGLITRSLALSIDAVEFVWHLLAIGGLAAALYKIRAQPDFALKAQPAVAALLVIVLIQTGLFAHSSLFATPTTREQFREHAYVNGFLRDDPLGWEEPFYETGNVIADRDYLTYWVLAQALVVEISGTHILLARYFVNPFVIIASAAAMYIFARNLGHRPKYALAYVILGLFGLSLVAEATRQPGGTFFALAIYDKTMASFALAPVAISTAFLCRSTGGWRPYFGFALSLLATLCTHPMIGGFAAVVIFAWCFVRVCTERGSRWQAIGFGLLTIVLVSPAILLRVNTVEKTVYQFDNTNLKTTRLIYVFETYNPFNEGSAFYAVNSVTAGELTYVLSGLVLLAVAASGLSARSKLVLAYVIMTGIALVPYTAWIYGRLVTARHIGRALWLFPYGYLIGFVIERGFAVFGRLLPGGGRVIAWLATDRALVFFLSLAAILGAHFLQFHHKADYSRDVYDAPRGDREYLEVAAYLDSNHSDRVWIAASNELHREVIGLTWKAISLSRYEPFRMAYHSNLTMDQAEKQWADNFRLYDAAAPVEEKLTIIDEYGIDYLFFPKQYSWMVDALYQADKQRFELVYSGETLRLVRVHEAAS